MGITSAQDIRKFSRQDLIQRLNNWHETIEIDPRPVEDLIPEIDNIIDNSRRIQYESASLTFYTADLQNQGSPQAMSFPSSPQEIDQIVSDRPELRALFGSLDSCACQHCNSVYSPAAYLVDLLLFLKKGLGKILRQPR